MLPLLSFFDELEKLGAVKTELQPHQERVVQRFLREDQPGLVVAHGLGSGKTLTSIAAQDALGLPADVIVPASLKGNYYKELKKHVEGKRPKADVQSMQNLAVKGLSPQAPLMIVDEAHRARDKGSATNQALSSGAAKKRMLLTASPFYNHPADIAPLINMAAGGTVLPNDRAEFTRQYISQERKSPGLWGLIRGVKPGYVEQVNPRMRKDLSGKLSKWVDYHPSSTEGFPSVERSDVKVEMDPQQLKMYDTLLGKAPSWVSYKIKKGLPPSKQESKQLNAFMQAVRQVSNSTAPFQTGGEAYAPKVEAAFKNLKERLENDPAARAIVFSNYLQAGLDPYKERLRGAGIPFGEYTGKLSKTERDELVKEYNTGKLRALLLSPAGGEGLDLKGTRLVQLLEPHWNNEKLRQAEGRAIRFGSHAHLPESDRSVEVQRYLSTRPRSGLLEKLRIKKPGGSADEYLAQLSADKEHLINQFRGMLGGQEQSQ